MKQVRFRDCYGEEFGGILLDDGNVICGCCGDLIEKDNFGEDEEFVLLEVYKDWIDLADSIIGEEA